MVLFGPDAIVPHIRVGRRRHARKIFQFTIHASETLCEPRQARVYHIHIPTAGDEFIEGDRILPRCFCHPTPDGAGCAGLIHQHQHRRLLRLLHDLLLSRRQSTRKVRCPLERKPMAFSVHDDVPPLPSSFIKWVSHSSAVEKCSILASGCSSAIRPDKSADCISTSPKSIGILRLSNSGRCLMIHSPSTSPVSVVASAANTSPEENISPRASYSAMFVCGGGEFGMPWYTHAFTPKPWAVRNANPTHSAGNSLGKLTKTLLLAAC